MRGGNKTSFRIVFKRNNPFLFSKDYKDKLELLKEDLEANVVCHGAWVEHKDLLVGMVLHNMYIYYCI